MQGIQPFLAGIVNVAAYMLALSNQFACPLGSWRDERVHEGRDRGFNIHIECMQLYHMRGWGSEPICLVFPPPDSASALSEQSDECVVCHIGVPVELRNYSALKRCVV